VENVHDILDGNQDGKIPLGIPRHRCDDNKQDKKVCVA
jgi:hypothetical protein